MMGILVQAIVKIGKENHLKESIPWKKENYFRSSRSGVFFGEGVLKICSTHTGEHSC